METVQKEAQLSIQIDFVIQQCVQERKSKKESISELARWLEIDRRKIMDLEKGKFNLIIANTILNWYGKEIILLVV